MAKLQKQKDHLEHIEAQKITEMVKTVKLRQEAENRNKEMFFSTAQANHRPRHGSRLASNSRSTRKGSLLVSQSKSKNKRIGVRKGGGKRIKRVKGGQKTEDRQSGAVSGLGIKREVGGNLRRRQEQGSRHEAPKSGFEYDYVRTTEHSSR